MLQRLAIALAQMKVANTNLLNRICQIQMHWAKEITKNSI